MGVDKFQADYDEALQRLRQSQEPNAWPKIAYLSDLDYEASLKAVADFGVEMRQKENESNAVPREDG